MIPLTVELASAMLDVVQRRNRFPRGMQFASSVLDAALTGAPDFVKETPNFVKRQAHKYDSPPVLNWKPVLHWKRS